MRKVLLAAATMIAICSAFSYAGEAQPVAGNPVLEKRVMAITQELRCLVCQNQTIADSHAELAIDLKNQVREKVAQGVSDKDIIDYMVQRYGDFVLYRPPLKSTTWLLWFGPFILMIGGLAFLIWKLRERNALQEPLESLDLKRAADLLDAPFDTKESL